MIDDKILVLVDRNCGFCSSWEKRLLRRSTDRIVFDDISRLKDHMDDEETRIKLISADSLIVIHRSLILVRYEAVRMVLRNCSGAFPLLAIMMGIIPKPIGDRFYGLVSRNRHRLGNCDIGP